MLYRSKSSDAQGWNWILMLSDVQLRLDAGLYRKASYSYCYFEVADFESDGRQLRFCLKGQDLDVLVANIKKEALDSGAWHESWGTVFF